MAEYHTEIFDPIITFRAEWKNILDFFTYEPLKLFNNDLIFLQKVENFHV
jgi:hypothetical protein